MRSLDQQAGKPAIQQAENLRYQAENLRYQAENLRYRHSCFGYLR